MKRNRSDKRRDPRYDDRYAPQNDARPAPRFAPHRPLLRRKRFWALVAILVAALGVFGFLTRYGGPTVSADGETLVRGGVRLNGSGVVPNGVKKIGVRAFSGCYLSLTNVAVPEGVAEIGDEAFRDCASLTNVVLPASVAKIGENAFAGCESLESIDVAEGNPAFRTIDGALASADGKTLVRGVVRSNGSGIVPVGVKRIGAGAFGGCVSATSVSLPASVEEIDARAFDGCDSLARIDVAEGNPNYRSVEGALVRNLNGEDLLCRGVVRTNGFAFVPKGVKYVGDRAFFRRSALTSVVLPPSVEIIGRNAFADCKSLTSVVIPAGVRGVDQNAFRGCVSLTSVALLDGDGSIIAEDAFAGCSSLTSVVLPPSVEIIGRNAFADCKSLTSVVLLGGVKEDVKKIGAGAFGGCSSLTSVVLPPNVSEIAGDAFEGRASGLTICGARGSAAERWATEKGTNFEPLDAE